MSDTDEHFEDKSELHAEGDTAAADSTESEFIKDPAYDGYRQAAVKVRQFPQTPGVYLMKDGAGRVIYVGKANNLRSRAGSYFLKAARQDARTKHWVHEIHDVDFLACESEVDALLTEARLIKDIQPPHNKDLKDGKSFPYIMISRREDFPRVEVTRDPAGKDARLYGPFTNPGKLHGALSILQRIFKFRNCSLDIDASDEKWKWYRPCLLASIDQCSAPCNLQISPEQYARDIRALRMVLDGKKSRLLKKTDREMQQAAKDLDFEKAAKLRDEIAMLESLDQRGTIEKHGQPEVFVTDPKKGLRGLRKVLQLEFEPRTIEGVDIAHLGGSQTVASLVQFIDGLPFKPGYRRFKINEVKGVDDFRSIHEVVGRRFQRLSKQHELFPDILLIDGGKGQLSAALAAFRDIQVQPPTLLALAKKEELIYRPGDTEPLRLSRNSQALKLLQYIRDEAHRFAQHYHHILRSKKVLDD
ncbi:MAG: excinuclease ABC subunit UvrC [Planctomycetota bacterium]|nr:excinuclease ABC subunit UvrC [Planctomycetota bacterium]